MAAAVPLSAPSARVQVGFASRTARVVLAIGQGDGTSRDASFNRIVDVAVSRHGMMYVLDNGDRVVKIFDAEGRFVRQFGRRGNGPGEFNLPNELRVTDSLVEVRDRSTWRIVQFTPDGRHVRTRTVESNEWTWQRYPMRGGITLVEASPEIRGFSRSSVPNQPRLRVIGLERGARRALDTLFAIRPDTVFYRREGMRGGGTPIPSAFGAGGAWARFGDSVVAHADGYTGTVTWYVISGSGARVARTASLGRRGQAVTPERIAAEEARLNRSATPVISSTGGRRTDAPSPGAIRLEATPSQWSVVTRALFGNDGSFWVSDQTWISVRGAAEGEKTIWYAFPGSGAPYTVALPRSFTLTAVHGNRLFGYDAAAGEPHTVVVYALE